MRFCFQTILYFCVCETMHVYTSCNIEHITWHYDCLKYVTLRDLDLVNMHSQDRNFKKGQMLH